MSVTFHEGQRIRLPGASGFETVDEARPTDNGWRLYLLTHDGDLRRVDITNDDAGRVETLVEDGSADPTAVLAGLWAEWMAAASVDAKAAALATTPLRAYAHQDNAVYGAMLPQPRLRFLLADEPGTGKTIMAGMYLREAQRLGFVRRALVVVPAHLVTKWQIDFDRFFGGGLLRIKSSTAAEGPLRPDHDLWIVSLDLASVNPAVQEIIRPDLAGWDAVVLDEAHRLTPTAQAYYRVGELLSRAPRVLLMTATPHRGKEWLFRALMHLVDPEVFPPSEQADTDAGMRRLRPGPVHFLRRMKEELVDYDGKTPLFKGRHAGNIPVALNATEAGFYKRALDLVDQYFPSGAVPLARMVYGKRAASSLKALALTLGRRRNAMGTSTPAAAAMDEDFDDPEARDEARVIVEQSRSAKAEREELGRVLSELQPLLDSPELPVSKWPRMVSECLAANGIRPGGADQAVVFTEYADTADWLVARFRAHGYAAERYSGRDLHPVRDAVRARFARRQFQILVSTDAGNEGIDLQTAHVLLNWDIPWSLVRLEQRMGRIHRVGQEREVELYNLVATGTQEGEVLNVLLENFVTAANQLEGKLFDSLSLVAELTGLDTERLLRQTYTGEPGAGDRALAAARAVTVQQLDAAAHRIATQENALRSAVDVASAVTALQRETLERINPRIVESFLTRIAATGLWSVSPHAGGEGLFVLRSTDGSLPVEVGGGARSVVVASSGAAVTDAEAAGAYETAASAVNLGPSDPAFRALVSAARDRLGPELYRGAGLIDGNASTDYDLFCFEAEITEAGGRRRSRWPYLIRVDDTGARRIRWEALANCQAGDVPIGPPHPAHVTDAEQRAVAAADEERDRRRRALLDWLAHAEQELQRLPTALTEDIDDPDRRRTTRRRLEASVATRLDDLRAGAQVVVGAPCRVGWARVLAAAPPPDPSRPNSDLIAMRHAAAVLRGDGWAVADISQESRGYDLHATRGRGQRCVEVKGVWQQASSDGISMSGNELLVARQLAGDYWLYVVDNCSDGTGRLYGTYRDPTTAFEGFMRDTTVISVPGSALKSARDEAVPA